jgi:hypothetical protein
LFALVMIEPHADGVLDLMIAGLRSQDQQTRANARLGIGKLAPAGRLPVQPLIEVMLDDKLPDQERHMMASVLLKTGDESLPPLLDLLTKTQGKSWAVVCVALAGFKERARAAVPELLRVAQSGDEQARKSAMWALVSIAPDTEGVLAFLVAAIEGQDLLTRMRAEMELKKLGLTREQAKSGLGK